MWLLHLLGISAIAYTSNVMLCLCACVKSMSPLKNSCSTYDDGHLQMHGVSTGLLCVLWLSSTQSVSGTICLYLLLFPFSLSLLFLAILECTRPHSQTLCFDDDSSIQPIRMDQTCFYAQAFENEIYQKKNNNEMILMKTATDTAASSTPEQSLQNDFEWALSRIITTNHYLFKYKWILTRVRVPKPKHHVIKRISVHCILSCVRCDRIRTSHSQ